MGVRVDQEPMQVLAAAEVLQDVVFILRMEPDLAFEYVSPSVVGLGGYTAEEHYADPHLPRSLTDPRDLATLDAVLSTEVGQLFEYTIRYRAKDGRTVWTEHRGRKERREDGSVALYAAVRDVTEQHETLVALARSESLFRDLAENASDVVFRANPAGELEWVSPSVSGVLGQPAEDLIGKSLPDVLHPDDLPSAMAALQAVQAGEATAYNARLRTSDGSYRWMVATSRPIVDAHGAFAGIIGSARDITHEVAARRDADLRGARLQAAMDAMLDPHLLIEAVRDESGTIIDFDIVDANPAALRHVRAISEGLAGRRLLDIVPGQERAGLMQMYAKVVETGQPLQADAVPYADEAQDGQLRVFDIRGVKVGDGLSLAFRDVTERTAAAEALLESETRYKMLAENASDIVVQIYPDGRIAWVSDSVTPLLGWSPQELVGRSEDLAFTADLERVREARETMLRGGPSKVELRVLAADGNYRWMSMTSKAVPTPEGMGRVVALRDIEDEVVARQELEHTLGHDALTGLANRQSLLVRLERMMADPLPGRRRSTGVLCVAVDSLRHVVNALSHTAGDQLITAVVARIVKAVGDSDRVGRGSGNEFFVLVPGLATRADAAVVADEIRAAVHDTVLLQGHSIDATVSIGITTSRPGDDPERLLQDAAMAMRQAKATGREGEAFADPTLAQEAEQRLAIEAGIRGGLRNQEFVAWYQPVVDLRTEEVTGYEALVRWIDGDGGVVPPLDFLPVAESTGLVVDLDLAVMEQATAALAKLPAPLTIAVNVSAATLAHVDYDELVLERLRRDGLDPARLHLEVTETTLLTLEERTSSAIRRLAEEGVRWYVDDFGTGFSSISHLRDLPIKGLKLDMSFTAAAATDDTSRRLADALSALARGLDLDTVAEGVETRRQAGILTSQGWVHAQGWLFGRPAPLDF